MLKFIIYQVDILSIYLKNLLDDNKFHIYINLLSGIEKIK